MTQKRFQRPISWPLQACHQHQLHILKALINFEDTWAAAPGSEDNYGGPFDLVMQTDASAVIGSLAAEDGFNSFREGSEDHALAPLGEALSFNLAYCYALSG